MIFRERKLLVLATDTSYDPVSQYSMRTSEFKTMIHCPSFFTPRVAQSKSTKISFTAEIWNFFLEFMFSSPCKYGIEIPCRHDTENTIQTYQ